MGCQQCGEVFINLCHFGLLCSLHMWSSWHLSAGPLDAHCPSKCSQEEELLEGALMSWNPSMGPCYQELLRWHGPGGYAKPETFGPDPRGHSVTPERLLCPYWDQKTTGPCPIPRVLMEVYCLGRGEWLSGHFYLRLKDQKGRQRTAQANVAVFAG